MLTVLRFAFAVMLTSVFLGNAVSSAHAQDADYILGAGDLVRVTVFGQPDLSGEFEVSSTGTVPMPLIGAVQASGSTIEQLENQIAGQLQPDYIKDPKVSIEVLNYRPFYIHGEIETPGSYPYRAGMTVLNAIVMGGGFTYRADKDDITIKRLDENGTENTIVVSDDTKVLPGDIIDIGMRFF